MGPHCSLFCVYECVHLLQAPLAPRLFYQDSGLCEGARSDPAVELTLLRRALIGGGGVHRGKAENGAELCKTDSTIQPGM